jgi:sulfonate dioxygenase
MSQTITLTETQPQPQVEPPATLVLQNPVQVPEDEYRYSHLLPHFSRDHYPPLTPFLHSDPGLRALNHANPRAFLQNATSVVELTPRLGTEGRDGNGRPCAGDLLKLSQSTAST